MAIVSVCDEYVLACNVCGTIGGEFSDFMEAVDWKKDLTNNWTCHRNGSDWIDLCPVCNGKEFVDDKPREA